MHPELREAATQGDKFYNNFIDNLCRTHPIWTKIGKKFCKGMNNTMFLGELKSNEFITQFYCGFKIPQEITNTGKKGDYVEAWIWFLVTNYGEEKAKEYIIKQLKIIANEK